MGKLSRALLITMITMIIFMHLNHLHASSTVLHICPFNSNSGEELSYEVEVDNGLIKKDLCTLDELHVDTIKRIENQEVLTKLIESEVKQLVQFAMIAFIPAEANRIAGLLFNTDSLDQLLPNTSRLSVLDINNMEELARCYPDFASIHNDVDFAHSQIFQAKVTYGEGLFRIVDQVVQHSMLLRYADSLNLYSNLVASDKMFKSAFNMFKLIPYQDGTILISYSNGHIKHPQASLFMDKIKYSTIKSFKQFVLDLKKMLGVYK